LETKTIEQFKEDRYKKYAESVYEGRVFDDVEYLFFEKLIYRYNFELFIDVGANEGKNIEIFIKNFRKNKASPKMIVFEPDKRSYKKLKEKDDPLNCRQFENIALYKHNFFKKLFYVDDTTQSSLKFKFQNKYKWVRCRTLDSYYNQIKNYKSVLIKIDAEGCEPEILQGMKKILSKYTGNIALIIEYSHKWLMTDKEKFKLFFNLMNNEFMIYKLNSFGLERVASNIVYKLGKVNYACLVAFKRIRFEEYELIPDECGFNEFIPIFNSVQLKMENEK